MRPTASRSGKPTAAESSIVKTRPTLEIAELFFSIQGESSYAGQPCVFIRLAGCNLRCHFCDARYAIEEPPTRRTLAELLAFAAEYPGFPVEVTGGEPLLQEGVYQLMTDLLAAGRLVLLETNGSLPLDRVPAGVIKIVDVKCPDSGTSESFVLGNLQQLSPTDELKFVISSRDDYNWAVDFLREHGLPDHRVVHFSPVTTILEPGIIADWILADRLPVRLQIQLHKVLWPEALRGK
ncbi:MAG: radical SAM protein [Desulfobulbaceae bacterium]|nr:radical SAM protein [Desulfobulbaceae bacterium]